jgi:RimJ/RimL family protein N-acetyltransferase
MPEEYLRKVDYSDMELLYQWANDPRVRANAFSSALIPFDVHQKWFSEKLASQNVLIFVYHCEGKDIGQIRLDIENNIAIIDYSIDSIFRGKGYGYKMMRLVEKKIGSEYPKIKLLQAQVKYTNSTSINIFRKLNYIEHREPDLVKFTKVLSSLDR